MHNGLSTKANRLLTKVQATTQLLANVFFPPKPPQTLVPADFQYPEPLPAPPAITISQLHQQVGRLLPYKVSGPDGIPNIVLQKTIDLVEGHLIHIYRAMVRLGVYVDSWREFSTIVL